MSSPRYQPLTALVLGGGNDSLSQAAGVASKGLVPLSGKPMAAYVLEALGASTQVATVVYVGASEGLQPYLKAATCVPAGRRLTDSLSLGLGAALTHQPEKILLLSADIPWLTKESVDILVTSAPEADLVYPVIPRAASEAQFPNQNRTYFRLQDGQFTGGNIGLVAPGIIPNLLLFVGRIYQGRKNPAVMGGILGLDIVFKLVTGRSSLTELERRISSKVGANARSFITEDARLGADIDKPEHLANLAPLATNL